MAMRSNIEKNLPLHLTMQQVLTCLGYHRREAPEAVHKAAFSMRLLALKSAKPCRIVSLQKMSVGGNKVLFNCHVFHSKSLSHLLKDSQEAALFLVTLGEKITQKIQQLLADKKPEEAYILDKIASLLTERFAQETQEYITRTAAQKNTHPTRRFSPGYGDWDVREQKKIFHILHPEKIGVKLTRRFMMIPEKSISAIFGMKKAGEQ